jgi:hypothetical protein
VALDRVDQGLDGLTLGIGQAAAGGVQDPLDQREGVLVREPVQRLAMAGAVEGRRQGLAAGQQLPGLTDRVQARGQGEDGLEAVGGLVNQERRGLGVEGARQQALQIVQHNERRLLAQGPLDRQQGLILIRKTRDAVAGHQLAAEGIEDGLGAAVGLDRDEGGALRLPRAHPPAGQLHGQRRLALAALAADQGPTRGAQASLERQELARAPDEAGRGRSGQRTEALDEVFLGLLHGARRRGLGEELGVGLLLVEHRHEPVLQSELPGAEDLPAGIVVLERALGGEHRIADALPGGQGAVEGPDEAPGRLDEHRVGHRDHTGDAELQELARNRLGGLLGQGRLAGLEEDQRDAVVAQQRAEVVGVDRLVAALVELLEIARVLEAEPAQALGPVVDAVAVERQRDDAIGGSAALLLHLKGQGQLPADPGRLQAGWAHEDQEGVGVADPLCHRRQERIAADQLARVDPDMDWLLLGALPLQGLLQRTDDGVVRGGVGEEKRGHGAFLGGLGAYRGVVAW